MNLSELRKANLQRYEQWCEGEKPTNLFHAVELAGEVGELLNEIKKIDRQRLGMPGGHKDFTSLEDEFGDVLICLDLLAASYGVDLCYATRTKFNKTSAKHGFSVFLEDKDRKP